MFLIKYEFYVNYCPHIFYEKKEFYMVTKKLCKGNINLTAFRKIVASVYPITMSFAYEGSIFHTHYSIIFKIIKQPYYSYNITAMQI